MYSQPQDLTELTTRIRRLELQLAALPLNTQPQGRAYGGALENEIGILIYPSGAAVRRLKMDSAFRAGTYTPTLTGVTNYSSGTAYTTQYIRLGYTIIVAGQVDVTPTGAGQVKFGVSLPIASNLSAAADCSGAGNAATTVARTMAIYGDATNDRAQFDAVAGAGSNTYYFVFAYQVI